MTTTSHLLNPSVRAVAAAALASLGAFALAQGLNDHGISLMVLCATWAVCGLSQTVSMGIGGIVTFGQAAFCAIGAFLYAYLAADRGFPIVVSICGAVFICALLASVGGLAILQLRGYVLSIGTLGVFMAASNLLPLMTWLSGGYGGRAITPVAIDRRTQAWVYAVIAIATLTAVHLLFRSRWGRRVVAIRDDEVAATSVGVPVFSSRLLVFSLAAGIGALGGIMYAAQIGYTSHEAFGLTFLTSMFVVAVVGGLRWVWGPLAGAVVYAFLQDATTSLGDKSALVYAVLFLAVMLVAPGGLYQLFVDVGERLRLTRRPVTDRREAKAPANSGSPAEERAESAAQPAHAGGEAG